MDPSDFYGIYGMTETVCLDHITDDVLRGRLAGMAEKFACSFCDRVERPDGVPFAIMMDDLGDHVWEAANWLYRWTEDVQYSDDGEPWSYEDLFGTSDVIYDTVEDAIDPAFSMPIVDRLVEATKAADYWVGGESSDPSVLGWAQFARTVRFESRFVFVGSSARPGFENEPPARLAKFLEALLAYVESDLVVELEAGTTLYRGRMTDDARRLRANIDQEPSSELGSAPPHLAEAGRLSPQGIGMFYAADELRTAVAEIALHSAYDEAVVGGFKTTQVYRILDFTRPMSKLPSIFATDPDSRRRWMFTRFKKHFTDMISAAVPLDGRQAVDYTPTQVVAEWLRYVPKARIHGIAWPSHVTGGKGKNVMLFLGPGPHFQTDPPTAAELDRRPPRAPSLTLSRDDISLHHAARAVTVSELAEDDYEDDYLFLSE
ncbi:RES domain-containing protein [Microbacterium binotii]|uniref:RES domain-containing protein n=1 Tax=Microbacterium binotii TaxID=462710 RepID=UPI001F246A47|nr:RES domain-containing protein [Microbacterium binotii]UIN30637.1 RES domain-containing protein [Microbacterium binotii]